MRKIIKKLYSFFCTKSALRKVKKHGKGVRCNFPCKFTGKTEIGNDSHFNGFKISGEGKIIIGNHFHSGKHIRVISTNHNYESSELPYDKTVVNKDVVIEDNVWLGEGVMILGGVTIGEGAVIQARSVVCKSVPPLAIAGGHPAVPFKYRDKEHYDELRKKQIEEDSRIY